MTAVRRLASTTSGAGFPHAEQGLETGDFPFVKVSDFNHVGNERVITTCTNWVTEDAARRLGATVVPTGSVLLPKVGAALLGNARRIVSQPSVFDNNILGVIPKKINSRYLHYWLTTIDAAKFAKPGPVPSMGDSGILDLRVPVISRPLQRTIADYLDTETGRIDALISKKRRMIELLDERLREVERSVTLSGNAPRVPLRWTMRIGSGEGLPSSTLSDNPVGGVPVYGGNGLMGYTPMQSRVNEHSIAIGRVGALCGNVHLVDPPAWITDNALWVRAIRGFDREFLATALRAANLNTAADRTAQPLITGETVKNLAIPQPSEDKQIEIAKAIRAARNKNMQLSDRLGRQLDLLRERRRTLITSAVTGRLAVPGVAA